MRKFEFEAITGNVLVNKYPGAFPIEVDRIIRQIANGSILHLYSGTSLIGDVRIDIKHPNATLNCDVEDFVKGDNRDWDFVILDPPYQITRTDAKLNSYGIKGSISANVDRRRLIKNYLQKHTDNILWLDQCAPMIKGFYRKKLWLVLPGAFKTVRVLSWLKREMKPLL
jgi:hypothetical protein